MLILGLRPANERQRYFIMASPIGWRKPRISTCDIVVMVVTEVSWCVCYISGNRYPPLQNCDHGRQPSHANTFTHTTLSSYFGIGMEDIDWNFLVSKNNIFDFIYTCHITFWCQTCVSHGRCKAVFNLFVDVMKNILWNSFCITDLI